MLLAHLGVHLHDQRTSILVSGAGESHHFGPITMVSVQHLFMANWHRFKYANPTVATRHGGNSGMGIISMVINDYSHKPMKTQLPQDWFDFLGPHCRWLGWCGYNSSRQRPRFASQLYWLPLTSTTVPGMPASTRTHCCSGEGSPYCLLWRWFCWAKYLHDACCQPRTQAQA